MIPRHRPPFGVGTIMLMGLKYWNRLGLEQIEEAFAQAADMPHAVLLPSARAGIYWALKAAVEQGAQVVCPAYTCKVVHEAIVRSGGQLHLVDTAETGFLMDDAALRTVSGENHATVLSEIYGYAYDLSTIAGQVQRAPRIRIVDMAMSVPHPQLFARLQGSDFAVISFGIGKCMYAGWGGMGFTRDDKLAAELRKLRASFLSRSNARLFIKRGLEILCRTLAHERIFYGFLRQWKQAKRPRKQAHRPPPAGLPLHWAGEQNLSGEWFSPSTYLDRGLAFYNLQRATQYYERRVALARRYHENFEGAVGIVRPSISAHPLSHYTIRVKDTARRAIREHLWQAHIDVGALFGFPAYLAKGDYPNASQMAAEILNLPLDTNLTIAEVDRISECVMRSVADFSGSAPWSWPPKKHKTTFAALPGYSSASVRPVLDSESKKLDRGGAAIPS